MKQHNLSYQGSKLLLYLRSGLHFLIIISSTLVYCPLIIAAWFLPFSVRYQLSNQWVGLVLWSTKIICKLDYVVHGLENIPTNNNGIILSKHQSAWETIALQKIFPPQIFLMKRELLWMPFWGWAMAALKPIAINRKAQKTALRILIEQGTARLNEGLWVVIFPEGTRTSPGERRKFNAGGALLAERSGFPVVPVAHNAGEFWPRYSFVKYPGTIQVRVGPVIDSTGRKAVDINQEVEHWISNTMKEISTQERK